MRKSMFAIVIYVCLMVPHTGKSQGGKLSDVLRSGDVKSSVSVTVDVGKPGVKVSPLMYGIFFEEINRAGDGGIYAEMLCNRSFEDNRAIELNWRDTPQKPPLFPTESWSIPARDWPVYAWSITGGTAELDQSMPINSNNPTALKVNVSGRTVVANPGFVPFRTPPGTNGIGLNIATGATYRLSLYARSEKLTVPLTARLESLDGTVLAEQEIGRIGPEWKKFDVQMKAMGSDPSARLALIAEGTGTLWLDMVSLFPQVTWKNRANGLRKDLMDMVEAMKPAFVRFPGGCFVEGDILGNAVRWKKTIGDIAERPGTWAYRGYLSTDGLGMHEYLLMCEDLKAEPLLVINCMMSHYEQKAPLNPQIKFDPTDLTGLEAYVQDALDAIEYCNGPVESKWGSLRARAGHPEPFNLKWIEVGNENGRKAYELRYAAFHKAIRAKYPDIKIISNGWKGDTATPVDYVDDHYYKSAEEFIAMFNKYDNVSRKGPKIYAGEYAVQSGAGKGNLNAAIGEAVLMIGLERNSDHVIMSSYAPLFTHYYWRNWNPDAIVFDQFRAFGTPSYHTQVLFSNHRPDIILPLKLESPATGTFFAGAGFSAKDSEVILKMVNFGSQSVEANISLNGIYRVKSPGKAWVLSGTNPGDENSFEQPRKIVPREETVPDVAGKFKHVFPPHSISVLRVTVERQAVK
jgi:alpha-L-arabinofuranosidase